MGVSLSPNLILSCAAYMQLATIVVWASPFVPESGDGQVTGWLTSR